MDIQQINQHVNNKMNEMVWEMETKLQVDNGLDDKHEQMRRDMETIKTEIQEVLQTKINENHALIEESARRMDALIKEAN